jgi:hypothetical protein
MSSPDDGVSRKVLLNSLALVLIIGVALVLFFLLGDNPTPLLEVGSGGPPPGLTTLG